LIAGATTAAIAVKLLSRPRAVDWEKNRETIFHAEHSRFVQVDDAEIHYQEAGDPNAPPLILVHGFASSTLVWSKVFLKLAEAGYRVIAPDMLGYGYTSKPRNGQYTIEGQSCMISRLMDRLGIGKATIIGSSYGGAVAATIALDYPERVENLILVGAVNNNDPLRFNLMRLFG